MNTRDETANRGVLSPAQRVIDPIVSTVAVGVLVGFFAAHQLARTGFFTERFGALEMSCVYGPLVLSLVAPITRAVSGRCTPARPLEALTDVCMVAAALWLLRVFPFDFTHLADVLPVGLRFSVAWVSDEIGRIVLLLQMFAGTLAAVITMIVYLVEQARASMIASDLRWRRQQPT
jgi:hypothetical protein